MFYMPSSEQRSQAGWISLSVFLCIVRQILTYACIGLIHLYRWSLSGLLGGQCRFSPSCSAYAIEALHIHGLWRGFGLIIKRLLRCHPWCCGGWDPVLKDE